jgi:parallel beta-helix repeat protein
LAACGGGGGGGGGNNSTNTPGPTPTVGPPVSGGAVFVRARGSDSNDGLTPDTAKRTIEAALLVLPTLRTGKTVIVGPGTYTANLANLPDGTRAQPVVLFADPRGQATQDAPGTVRLSSETPDQSVVRLREARWVTLDGFSIRGPSGANLAAIEIRNSADVVVRNCEIFGGSDNADGISLRDSNRVLLFNNLVFDNDRRGILIAGNGSGSSDVQVINNTIVSNGNRGVVIGTSTTASQAALLFNIIQDNGSGGVVVSTPSLQDYASDLNLVFPNGNAYSPSDLPHDGDVNEDALFVAPGSNNYRLSRFESGQPDDSPALDLVPPSSTPDDLAVEFNGLAERTTSNTGEPDNDSFDLGFHYRTEGTGPGPVENVYYVRIAGNDERASGRSPADAFRTIRHALDFATPGDTIIVGPGNYGGQVTFPLSGSPEEPIILTADPTGRMTEDAPAPVLVSADVVGFQLTEASFIVIDGFEVLGAQEAGIRIRNGSFNITVRNCIVRDGRDGIRVEDSDDIVLFNNLVIFNDQRGIVVERSAAVSVVNNTVSENADRGIQIGTGILEAPLASLQNNIVQDNGRTNVDFNDISAETGTLAFNLVFPGDYRPDLEELLPRPTDINDDALFVSPFTDDFRLLDDSPAIDAGDPATIRAYIDELSKRTTKSDELTDSAPADLGYHYPILPPLIQ